MQNKVGLSSEPYSPDVTIHLPAESTILRRKSVVEEKTSVQQPRSKSFSGFTSGKVQAV